MVVYDYLVVLVLVVVGQGFRCDAEKSRGWAFYLVSLQGLIII